MHRIPKDVYYRCVWLIRDSIRLERITEACCPGNEAGNGSDEKDEAVIIDENVIRRAETELTSINKALHKIPEAYRREIIANIIYKSPFSDIAHPNTWKKWKQIFIYELAHELHLI
ncbi:MAG: hypothetical protein IJH43_03765 [Mogibacterium sp.]|nr:hypothetical protein [Mogibacterium sp.]